MTRPVGLITRALAQAWSHGPAPVAVAAQRACVGFGAARYTASRMVARGDLVVVAGGRPLVLGLSPEADPQAPAAEPDASQRCMAAMDLIEAAFWGRRP